MQPVSSTGLATKRLENLDRGVYLGTAALFAMALVLGGLGPHAPFLSAVIEAAAFPLLVAVAVFRRDRLSTQPSVVAAILFILLLLMVGTAQVLPLPAETWRQLPGREVPALVFAALGIADRSHTLSVAPDDTRLVIQSWLPPITIFFAAITTSGRERRWLGSLVVIAAALSSILGLAQLSFGDGTLMPYVWQVTDRYPGAFANFNHQALLIACAVALLPAIVTDQFSYTRGRHWWLGVVWVLFLFGVLITSSRAGLALFAFSSTLLCLRAWNAGLKRGRSFGRITRAGIQRWAVVIVFSLMPPALLGWSIAEGYRSELLSSRFEAVSRDPRYGFWTLTIPVIHTYFPFGSGLGTFESVYQINEPIESVKPYIVNHAHNDYMEFILEAGAAGFLLIVLFFIWFGARLYHIARTELRASQVEVSGATIVVLVLFHSIVDYPLRTETIGCLFAFACATLLKTSPEMPGSERRTS